MGATGGYLVGCMIAAPIISIIKNRPLLKLYFCGQFVRRCSAQIRNKLRVRSGFEYPLSYKFTHISESNISQKFWPVAFCCFIGHIIIYFFGITWLSQFMSLNNAIYNGFIVFIPSGIVKIVIFSYLFSYTKSKAQI
jgi:biotin transporter BioY